MISKIRNTYISTFLAAAIAATAVVATAPSSADACGFYSNESALEYYASRIFWSGEADGKALASQFPQLSESERGLLMIGKATAVKTRWTKLAANEKKATVIVEVQTEVPGCRGSSSSTAKTFFEVSMETKGGMYGWAAVGVKRASAEQVKAIAAFESVKAASARLVASLTPAKR